MEPAADLERLYDEHASAVFAFLLNLVRDEADTRDLLQEVFLKLVRDPRCLDGVQNRRSYLLRIAHHRAIDLIRRRAARETRTDRWAHDTVSLFAATDDPDQQALRGLLADALARLPPDQRAVVHLKLWEEMTFEAIGEVLAVSPNTAASRYRYGLDKLRERLRPVYEERK